MWKNSSQEGLSGQSNCLNSIVKYITVVGNWQPTHHGDPGLLQQVTPQMNLTLSSCCVLVRFLKWVIKVSWLNTQQILTLSFQLHTSNGKLGAQSPSFLVPGIKVVLHASFCFKSIANKAQRADKDSFQLFSRTPRLLQHCQWSYNKKVTTPLPDAAGLTLHLLTATVRDPTNH